jgi:hypothetical protein
MKARARLTTQIFALGFALGLCVALAAGARAENALLRASGSGALCGSAAWLCSRLVPVHAAPKPVKDRAV